MAAAVMHEGPQNVAAAASPSIAAAGAVGAILDALCASPPIPCSGRHVLCSGYFMMLITII
jgi:hypothetical protein